MRPRTTLFLLSLLLSSAVVAQQEPCPPGAAWGGSQWLLDADYYVNGFMNPTLPLAWDPVEDERKILGYQLRLTTSAGETFVDLPCTYWTETPEGPEPCEPTYNSISDDWGRNCDGQWCPNEQPIIRHVDPDAGTLIEAVVRAWNHDESGSRQYGGWSNGSKSCHAFLMR